jgi:predicted amidohydrolase YtcJ
MKNSIRFWALGLSFVLLSGIAALAQQTLNGVPAELVTYPDTIVHNGKIITSSDTSLSNSLGRTVQAMAIKGDRILAIGSDADILRLAGPQTKKVDVKGHTVTAGIINTHTHLHDAAVNTWARNNPQKVEAVRKNFTVTGKTFADITKGIELVIKEQMARPIPGQWAWIDLPTGQSGSGLGIDYLMQKQMSRDQLDKLAPKMPVFVGAHPAFLWNTAARNAFLDWYEVEPTDANEKKAITIDTTMGRSLIADFYFDKHMSELADVIADHLDSQTVVGVTTFSSHIVGLRKMPAYTQLVQENRMPIRFAFSNRYCQQIEVDIPGCFLRAGDYAGLGDRGNYFWNVGITLGGIDNGPPAVCTTMEGPAEFKAKEECIIQPGNDYWKAVYAAIRSRYRYVVNHSWGDKGVDYVLDIMDELIKDNPESFSADFFKSRRFTSDHCGFYPTPSQLPRMARFGWMVSCTTNALTRSAPYLQVYGKRYENRLAPIGSTIKAGVMPTFEAELGVDMSKPENTVEPLHLDAKPFITRVNRWGDVISKDDAVDRETLLKMNTIWAAYYVLREKELGSLEPGKFADYVVWNKDYLTVPIAEFQTLYPLMTVVGNKTKVLREEFAKVLGVPAVGKQAKWDFDEDKPEPVDLLNGGGGGE